MADANPPEYAKYIDEVVKVYGKWTVTTYKVLPLNLKHGPDDATYQKYPELVRLIPRGYSKLHFNGAFVCELRGLSKFDGTSSIDEDDFEDYANSPNTTAGSTNTAVDVQKHTNDAQKPNSIFPINTINDWATNNQLEVVFAEKANGKFAIFKLFMFEEKLWIFGGSKNVHVVSEFANHVNNAELHNNILHAVISDLKKLTTEQFDSLIGKSIIGEYVDGMHLVWTEAPYMVYFNTPQDSGLPAPKHILPSCRCLPTMDSLRAIRNMINVEGVVIEYHNTESGEIVRQKHKTEWYIIWRCFREILSKLNKKNISVGALIAKLKHKLHVRSDQFLHLSDDSLKYWNQQAVDFVNWMNTVNYEYRDCGHSSSVGMAELIHKFEARDVHSEQDAWDAPSAHVSAGIPDAAKTEVHSEIDAKHDHHPQQENKNKNNIGDYLVNPDMYRYAIIAAQYKFKVIVIMSGLPGSGKSTVAHKLLNDLGEFGISAARFSTDEYFMIDGVYNFRPNKLAEYHHKNLEAFMTSDAQVRIVDNTNLSLGEYDKYLKNSGKAIRFVLNTHPADVETLVARTTHGVPALSISAMIKKQKFAYPAYYGLFPVMDTTEQLIKDNKIPVEINQKTPFHVTSLYVGGHFKKDKPVAPELLGTMIEFICTGHAKTFAGDCLTVECAQLSGNHITLSTRDGFKPVEVGEAVGPSNIELWGVHVRLAGLYLPFY